MNFFKTKFLPIFITTFAVLAMTGCGSSASSSDEGPIAPPPEDIITLTNVIISSDSDIIEIGVTEQYTAVALYSDGETEDITSTATWKSSNDTIATIDADGLATGYAEGKVILTATYAKYGTEVSGTADLEVYPVGGIVPVSLKIEGDEHLFIDSTTDLNAYATLSDGSTHHVDDRVQWSSSQDSIATVDKHGVVTGHTGGSVTITATGINYPAIIATHDILVEQEISGIIVEENFVFGKDIVISANRESAYGSTDGENPTWYYTKLGGVITEGQPLSEINFKFDASMDKGTAVPYVNVYLKDENGDDVSTLDSVVHNNDEWETLKKNHPNWTLRKFNFWADYKLITNTNFILRFGGKNYNEDDTFNITEYILD